MDPGGWFLRTAALCHKATMVVTLRNHSMKLTQFLVMNTLRQFWGTGGMSARWRIQGDGGGKCGMRCPGVPPLCTT